MRYLFLLFVVFALTLNAQTITTSTVAEESIEIPRDSSATVLNWLEWIATKGIILSYNSSSLDLEEKVFIKIQKVTVRRLLELVLGTYDYEINPVSAQKFLIKIKGVKRILLQGVVQDESTLERLPLSNIRITNERGDSWNMVADTEGAFSKTLPPGKYQVSVKYIGYQSLLSSLTLLNTCQQTYQLKRLETPLKEVIVSPSPFADEINHKGARNKLSVNGNDPLSQVMSLPGISGSTVSGNFHVNGGQNDENLVLMDGISFFHFHHNNSLLSQFNGDVVQKVSFYDGFIPARYEGRLSSVTDVRIKEGDSVRHHQTLSLTLPSGAVNFDGPIVKNKLTYVISGRHSWIDLMEDIFSSQPKATRTFKDVLGKLSYNINPRTSLHGLFYQSRDQYNDSVENYRVKKVLEWRNTLCSVTMKTQIANKISNQNSVAYTAYKNRIFAPIIAINSPIYVDEGIKKISVKSHFSTVLDQHSRLTWGFSLSNENFNLLASKDTVENNKQHVLQLSTYISSHLKIARRFDGGVALNVVGYMPKGHLEEVSLQPRFTFRYLPNNRNSFSFAFSRMEQFYHNICLGEIPLPTDLRMPSVDGIKPSSSLHIETAWKHTNPHWGSTLSSFYKRRYHILGVRYNVAPELEGWGRFIMEGNASSFGVKLHTLGVWNRWLLDLSYTYSRSYEWFEDYDNNKKNPTLHDLPHMFNYAVSYRLKKRSYLSLGGYVKSGTNHAVYDYDDISSFYVFERKRDHTNHRLDFNFSDEVTTKNNRMTFSYKVGLYNIIGNPKDNEVIDLYSTEIHKHCLPYFTLKMKF